MKRIIALLVVLATALSLIGVSAQAFLGSGYELVASEVEVVKTGLYGEKLTFSDADFKQKSLRHIKKSLKHVICQTKCNTF